MRFSEYVAADKNKWNKKNYFYCLNINLFI